ncbi:MAG: hypothetical protein AB7T86_16190, partial [Xanthobacteraceae bacterium]
MRAARYLQPLLRIAVAVAALLVLAGAPARAQSGGPSLFSTAPSATLVAPSTGSQGSTLVSPGSSGGLVGDAPLLLAPPGAAPTQAAPRVPAGHVALQLS